MSAAPLGSSDDASATRAALGAGFVLLCSVFGSFVLAYAMSLTIGGIYVPFLMPLVMGLLIGTIGSFVARRFQLLERRPVVLAALLGATIAYLGYHALAYLRVLDMLALQWAPHLAGQVADGTAPDGASAALAVIEHATGESGFMAYLTFVSSGQGAIYSPLGLLGRAEPGVATTIIIAVVELAMTAAMAVYAMIWRTHARARPGLYVRVDDATLTQLHDALGDADWARAGRALAATGPDARYAITLESSGGAMQLTVFRLDAGDAARAVEERKTLGEVQAKMLGEAYTHAKSMGANS